MEACDFGHDDRELWQLLGIGEIYDGAGTCLTTNDTLSGSQIVDTSANCNPYDLAQKWEPGPGGQLINVKAGKCLADPNNGKLGTHLVLNDCNGDLGEIWGLN